MSGEPHVDAVIVGCGGMARHHLPNILKQKDQTTIVAVCEPSAEAYAATAEVFAVAGLEVPPNEPDLERLLAERGTELDAAFIITPHALHHDQAKACLQAGLDVLLEKPMVMSASEARSLIRARDETGRLLVVAFNGSLSPQIRAAAELLSSGQLGDILTISATIWQNWGAITIGAWRQEPELSGGGFIFDTGAHMLNTVADLAGDEFVEVAAWLDNAGRPVETLATVMARLGSGAMVTMTGCGETIPSCASSIYVFCTKGIVYTDAWGKWLKVQRHGRRHLRTVNVRPSLGVWEQFLAVRDGSLQNPCPPEVGLRMALLWDAIKVSAAQGGTPVGCG